MKLHVESQGQGPDLVLLHGWAMHSGVFAELLPTLTAHHRVHCIDLPGHGRSGFDPAMGNLQALADLLQPYVPRHSLVLGWSLGGLLALKLAQQMPLQGLILSNTTPCFVANDSWSPGMAQAIFAQFFSRLQQNLRSTVQDFLALQVRGDSDAVHTLATLQAALLATPGDAQALQLGLQILRDADERAHLASVTAPTLVVVGEYDRITHPKAGDYLATHLPQARCHWIKRAGHAPFISHRSEFIATVNAFLVEQHDAA